MYVHSPVDVAVAVDVENAPVPLLPDDDGDSGSSSSSSTPQLPSDDSVDVGVVSALTEWVHIVGFLRIMADSYFSITTFMQC